jgi:Holliday junction resolvase RusA-like endonuclease
MSVSRKVRVMRCARSTGISTQAAQAALPALWAKRMSSQLLTDEVYHVDAWGARLTIHGLPQTAGSKRAVPRGGRIVVFDDNPKSGGWKDTCGKVAMALMSGRKPFEQPLELRATFFMPRPGWHYGRKGTVVPRAPRHHAVKPDTTKLLRALEDGLTGQLWKDDAQIVQQFACKVFCAPGEERAVVVVKVLA